MTVKRLLLEADSLELAEWEAYDRLEPIDHAYRVEVATAILASTFANSNRDKNKDPYPAEDFIQTWGAKWRKEVEVAEDPEILVTQIAQDVENAAKLLGLAWH